MNDEYAALPPCPQCAAPVESWCSSGSPRRVVVGFAHDARVDRTRTEEWRRFAARPDTWTAAETAAYHDYVAATEDARDAFDRLADINVWTHAADLPDHDELVGLVETLRRWWVALDALDAAIGIHFHRGRRVSHVAEMWLHIAFDEWFAARQNLLFAAARLAGVEMPRPDLPNPDHSPGSFETSNHVRGSFGFDHGFHHEAGLDG